MNNFFNTRYDKIMSLGSSCFPKFFIENIVKPTPNLTELFDFIGTSMMSINALIRNDFKDMLNPEEFFMMPIMEGFDPIVTNMRYYLRFKHELATVADARTEKFKSQIVRRVERFKNYMTSCSNILFIRYQENDVGRKQYFKKSISEYDEIEIFLAQIRLKYKCNPTVIYINLEKDGWNAKHNILSVKIDALEQDYKTVDRTIENLFIKKRVIEQLIEPKIL